MCDSDGQLPLDATDAFERERIRGGGYWRAWRGLGRKVDGLVDLTLGLRSTGCSGSLGMPVAMAAERLGVSRSTLKRWRQHLPESP